MNSEHPEIQNSFEKRQWIWVVFFALLAFFTSFFSTISYTQSDSFGTLLTSQAILEHGTIRLDSYDLTPFSYQLKVIDGNTYYFPPLGSAIYSLPFVFVGNKLGMDMANVEHDAIMQKFVAALTVSFAFFLTYLLSRRFVGALIGLFFSIVFIFGSSVISTMGTALWSTNFEVVFLLLAFVVTELDDMRQHWLAPYLLGFISFLAFFTRPTAALFIVFFFLYVLFSMRRSFFFKMAVTSLLSLVGFVVFSLNVFHSWLPPYYLVFTSSHTGFNIRSFLTALFGSLISPSRGVFIYNAFLLLTIPLAAIAIRRLSRIPLFLITTGWFTLHSLMIAGSRQWWGGWGFGSRLFVDVLPGALVLSLLSWREYQRRSLKPAIQPAKIGIVFLAGFSIFVNSYQGLYNHYSAKWNSNPAIDDNPQLVFDWKHPQFLASQQLITDRYYDLLESRATFYHLGDIITPDNQQIIFDGWHALEYKQGGDIRWSAGNASRILFMLDADESLEDREAIIEIRLSTFGPQRVAISLNGSRIGELNNPGFTQETYYFSFDSSILKHQNIIEFFTPEAISPADFYGDNPDQRILGFRLFYCTLRGSGQYTSRIRGEGGGNDGGAESQTIVKWAPVDFNGDGTSEIVVFSEGAWRFFDFDSARFTHGIWTSGTSKCIPTPMDYDGDGGSDFSIFCEGAWHFYNDDGSYLKGIWTGSEVGAYPVPADYDGDGMDDVVVWRAGAWRFFDFESGLFDRGVWTGSPAHWHGGTNLPVPMDYDGDGKAEYTVYAGGPWHFYNEDGSYNKGIWTGGVEGDLPVPGDYDNDLKEEIVIWRDGAWRFFDFDTGISIAGVWTGSPKHWAGGDPLPAPLDYDGDGDLDYTVFSGGPWHFFNDDGSYRKGIWTGDFLSNLPISRRRLP